VRSVSVVIPTYNGKDLLEKNLPSVLSAADASPVPVEIVVVDDGSRDGSVEFLRDRFPGVRVLANDRNEGFAETMNRGIRSARNEIVFSLNNDIEVGRDLFTRGLERFDDPDVFSVTPIVMDVRSGKCQSISRLRPGICWYASDGLEPGDLPVPEGEIPVFYALGGATFYDREKLLRLEGFDTIYHPFYMEDVDLSYRAWKTGWKCLLEPRTSVYHENSSTISSLHRRRKIKFLVERHRTLLLWLNVTDPWLIVRYFLCLPFSMLYDIVAFRKYKFAGFFLALRYLPRIPAGRRKRKALFRIRDRDVFLRLAWRSGNQALR